MRRYKSVIFGRRVASNGDNNSLPKIESATARAVFEVWSPRRPVDWEIFSRYSCASRVVTFHGTINYARSFTRVAWAYLDVVFLFTEHTPMSGAYARRSFRWMGTGSLYFLVFVEKKKKTVIFVLNIIEMLCFIRQKNCTIKTFYTQIEYLLKIYF